MFTFSDVKASKNFPTLAKFIEIQIKKPSASSLTDAVPKLRMSLPVERQYIINEFTDEFVINNYITYDNAYTENFSELIEDAVESTRSFGDAYEWNFTTEECEQVVLLMFLKVAELAYTKKDYRKYLGIKNGFFGSMRGFLASLYSPALWVCLTFGVVGFVWLLYAGEWKTVLGGLLVAVAFPRLFGFLNLPQLGLNKLAEKTIERHHFVAIMLVTLGSIWRNSLLSIWYLLTFVGCIKNSTIENLVPSILWANYIAVMPIYYMASFDKGHFASELLVTLASTAMLTFSAMFILFDFPILYFVYAAVFYALFVPLSAFAIEAARGNVFRK